MRVSEQYGLGRSQGELDFVDVKVDGDTALFVDPSAVSTRRGGGFYGFKLHLAVCVRTGLPVAWNVATARAHEASLADDLLARVRERVQPETASLDKGYDVTRVYDA